MSEGQKKLVLPGERLGVIEEILPGDGAYVDGEGKVRSARLGYLTMEGGRVNVEPVKRPLLPLKPGTEVIGIVWGTERALHHVKIIGIAGKRPVKFQNPISGIMLKSHPANQGARPGDLILAKVMRADSEQVVVTMAGPSLGVILARCPKCGAPLKRVGYTLVCEDCGRVVLDRRVSDLYGQNPLRGSV